MKRLLAALGACLAPLATMPLQPVTVQAATTTTYHVQQDVRIAMDDGALLDSDNYIPDSGCPCPVILIQTPYRKSGGGVAEANPYFPQHGYAEIVVDVRGTGSSEGYWDSFGPREQKDGVLLVQYAVRQPFSNGKVGLAGVSYSAINQLLTVEEAGTTAVKAIFPIVPMSDAYRDVTFAGGNTDSGFIPLWLGLVTGLSVLPAQDAATLPAVALNAESQHLYDITRFQAPVFVDSISGRYEHQLPAQIQTYPDQAYDGPFSRVRSPIEHIGNVHVPTFIVGGEYDIFQRGEPILYNGLGLPNAQKKLVYGPWYHITAGNGLPATDVTGRTIPALDDLQLAWFDHWLKGAANGVDAFPQVEAYQLGAGTWVPSSIWPLAGTYGAWYMGSGGSLSQTAAGAASRVLPYNPANGTCSRSTTQWTAGIAAGTPCENDNRLTDAQGLSFTTAPRTTPLTFSGPISARLFVSSTRPDATLIATIEDVAPDGSSRSITAGSLVASLRTLTTRPCANVVLYCSVIAGGVPVEPWHPYTYASQQPLTPGKVYELWIEVFPTFARIAAGHSLRVTVTASDVPHESPSLSTSVDSAGAVLTLYFGGRTPSTVYVRS
ncbi:MAG TPA: CocE/NonD family hydrolase [Candidatus Dormibacteraeota bacterium]